MTEGKTYSGYCVGGPWTGQSVAHYARMMEVVMLDEISLQRASANPMKEISARVKKYEHINGSWIWEDYLGC